jgi:cobalt-zinc-cadmium efflux system outer membrane protein
VYARLLTAAASGVMTLLLAGCVGPMPRPDAEAAASEAIGLVPGEPLVFRTEAEPIEHPSTAPAALDVAQVVRLSVLRSPEVQAALARVRVAQAEAQQARLLPNPIVSVGLRFPESGGGKPVIDAGIAADLLAVLRRPGATSAADARLRASSADAVVAVLDIAARAQEHFIAVQSLEASLVVLQERSGLLRRLHDLAESRLRVGEGTRLDVITIQTQQVELEADIADRTIELRDERLALARLVGQPGSAAEWTIAAWSPSSSPEPEESELLSVAASRRPEIQQREWELVALGADRKLAGWGFLGGTEVGLDAERDGDWTVGPSASIPVPLFDVGQASKAWAQAAVIEARHQLVATQRGVVEEVRRAHATLVGTQANLARVQDQLIPLQQSRLTQAEAQFRAGQTDITALLLAEQDLRSTQAQVVELQRRVAIAQVRLERAVGGSLSRPTPSPATQPNP